MYSARHDLGGRAVGAYMVLQPYCVQVQRQCRVLYSRGGRRRVNNSERISCVELAVRPLRRVLLLVWGRERDNSDAGRQQRR